MANVVQLYFRKIAIVDEAGELLRRPSCGLFARRGIGLRNARVIFPMLWDAELGGFDIRDNTATKLKQLKTIDDLVDFYRKLTGSDASVSVTFPGGDDAIMAVNADDPLDIPWSNQ